MMRRILHWLSAWLFRHPRLAASVRVGGLRTVWRAFDMEAASRVVRRPAWLRNKTDSEGSALQPPLPFSVMDPGIADRILAAYGTLVSTIADRESNDIWGDLRATHLVPVATALADRSGATLSELGGKFFRTSIVNGFSYGSTYDRWPHRWNYLPLMIELSIVNLAESLGLIRMENPEQGDIAQWRSMMRPSDLIETLEGHLGIRIEHPRAGDPRGINFGNRFLARETCSQIYTAVRIREGCRRAHVGGPLNVVEIGGGYGGLAYWIRELLRNDINRYAIIDLPEVSAIQAMFLSQALPGGVAMPGERSSPDTIQLVVNTGTDALDFRPTVVINQDSMPEMPQAVAGCYLDWLAQTGASIFASFNHEALSPNSPSELQGWIPELIAERPAFERLSRELSWDRPGYVEEFYRINR